MDANVWTSLILVAAGAAVTLITTSVVELFKTRRLDRVRAEDRVARRHADGVVYAQNVLDILGQLSNDLNDFAETVEGDHGYKVKTEYSRLVYRTFLLIPEPSIRTLVQNGIYALNNYDLLYGMPGRNPDIVAEQQNILFRMTSNLAAYIRGDEPNPVDLAFLQGRADYVDVRIAELDD